jgi:hypothetical protein
MLFFVRVVADIAARSILKRESDRRLHLNHIDPRRVEEVSTPPVRFPLQGGLR